MLTPRTAGKGHPVHPAQELAEAAAIMRADAGFCGLVGKVLDDAATEYAQHSPEIQAILAGTGDAADLRVGIARQILQLPRPAGVRAPVRLALDGTAGTHPVREIGTADDRRAQGPERDNRAGHPEPW